jgi:hypothetical protein
MIDIHVSTIQLRLDADGISRKKIKREATERDTLERAQFIFEVGFFEERTIGFLR